MDDRLTEFLRGLRAAGVAVSTAEGQDALRAAGAVGVADPTGFRLALRATLVKSAEDFAAFDALFPLYFGGDGPPLQNALGDLGPEDEALVRAALAALGGRLRQLLDWLSSGEPPSAEELEALARRAGIERARGPGQSLWLSRRLLRELGFDQVGALLAELAERLRQAGMREDLIADLVGAMEANREALAERVARQMGLSLARQRAERGPLRGGGELADRPFEALGPLDVELLRYEIRRMVALLRSRAALRQRRAQAGRLDPRRTLRTNLRHGGVPFALRHRRRRQKPRLALICDVSTSMRPVAEFMLRLIYELQDQVAQARSFAFNEDLLEISPSMRGPSAAEAVAEVLYAIPPGYYATDLGRSLTTLWHEHAAAIDARSTVIILGDGRNNHRDPRLDLLGAIARRARRLVWLNPEDPARWGRGDSDMLDYAPICDAVFPVRNLAQLSAAVDRLLAGD